jgi:Haloacid dehalogenase-like hydrolase
MSRPLLISDCDEVLLFMLTPFAEWLDEAHDVHFGVDTLFDEDSGGYLNAMHHKLTGDKVEQEKIWPFLKGFFETEMHRQKPIPGAVDAINALAQHADVVVLTNLTDDVRDARAAQLRAIGIDVPVYTNQGGKGELMARIIADYRPSVAVFVDDLAHQHHSVAQDAPDVIRLHMVGEPRVASQMKTSPAAHARIDDWRTAQGWIMERFEGVPL